MTLDDISAALPAGLQIMGAYHPTDGETLVLLGPDEPEFWGVFTRSDEYLEKQENPVDQWSMRVIGTLAEQLSAQAIFPFGGPPYHPFIAWALASGRAWQSPVGLLVHDTAGLFVSYRGALLIPKMLELPKHGTSPCHKCEEKPCLSACPAAALTSASYDVTACHGYLDTLSGADCLNNGCLVRRNCPIGQNRRLPAQSAFHMRAFHKG